MKKPIKKLAFRPETVRILQLSELAAAHGGGGASEYPTNCQTEVCNPSSSGPPRPI